MRCFRGNSDDCGTRAYQEVLGGSIPNPNDASEFFLSLISFKNYERYEQETSRKLIFSELREASKQIVNP